MCHLTVTEYTFKKNIHTCIHNIRTYVHTYIPTDRQTYIDTCVHTCMHIHMHTHTLTYRHIYIQTYTCTHVHTYIHIHIQTYMPTYAQLVDGANKKAVLSPGPQKKAAPKGYKQRGRKPSPEEETKRKNEAKPGASRDAGPQGGIEPGTLQKMSSKRLRATGLLGHSPN